MKLGEPLGQGQAQAGAFELAGMAGVNLPEGLKGNLNLIRGHPRPGIAHLEDDATLRPAMHGDDDGASLLGKFECIGDQVQQDLLEPRRVAGERRQLVLDVGRQADPSERCASP